nr:reverse transcriptase domain-containing protein [Tanacetum cinerariifolium]
MRTQKTSSALEALWKTLFYSNCTYYDHCEETLMIRSNRSDRYASIVASEQRAELFGRIGMLEWDNMRLSGMLVVERQRVDNLWRSIKHPHPYQQVIDVFKDEERLSKAIRFTSSTRNTPLGTGKYSHRFYHKPAKDNKLLLHDLDDDDGIRINLRVVLLVGLVVNRIRESSQSLGLVQDLPQSKLEGLAQQVILAHLIPALQEYCDKHYHQLLPIIAEKVYNEKVQQEKLKEAKARLNFEGSSRRNSKIQEMSQYSESRTPNKRGDLRGRLKPRRPRSLSKSLEQTSVFYRIQQDRSASPRRRQGDKRKRGGDVFHRLGPLLESKDSGRGHWKSKSRKQKSSIKEEDLSQPWTCKEADPFTPRICYFKLPKKSRMPNNVKTYNGSNELEDHLKIFQAAAKVERLAMSTWFHMFTSILTGSARKGKFKAPPPMTTPMEKGNGNKFCEFHGEVGHNTDECMHLKRKIEELIKNGKPLHVIKEFKQDSRKDQPKTAKKGETSRKDKPLEILMVQPWQRVARQKVTQSVSPRDAEHSTSTMMNFVVVRSQSPYNGIIGRPRVRKIQAIPSTAHRMLKFPVPGRIITLWSSRIILLDYTMVFGPEARHFDIIQETKERIKMAIHLEHPKQTIAIGFTLTKEGRKPLCDLLRRSLDIFAWKPADMIGVSRYITEHRLNIRKGCSPVRQKKRSQAPERNKAIQEEIGKNLEVYVNDLLIKSHTEHEIIRDIEETFKALRMLKKCTKKSDFQWTAKAEATFKQMKRLIAELPTLTAPMEKEKFIVYIATAREATKNNSQRENIGRLHCRTSRRWLLGHSNGSGGGTSRPMNIVYGRVIHVDGFEASLILTDSEGAEFTYALIFIFEATNNKARYEALIAGLKIAEQIAKETVMVLYLKKVKTLSGGFKKLSIKQVLVKELKEKSINVAEVLSVVEEEGYTWMTPIYKYLMEETLPMEKEKARAIRRKSKRYAVVNGILYKKAYLRL